MLPASGDMDVRVEHASDVHSAGRFSQEIAVGIMARLDAESRDGGMMIT